MKLSLVLAFIIMCTIFLNAHASGNEDVITVQLLKERSVKLVNDVIVSLEAGESSVKAIHALRDSIAGDKNKKEDYRRYIYTEMYITLRDNKQLSLQIKRCLFDFMAEGTVNDNSLYLKHRIIKHLSQLIDGKDNSCLSNSFMKNIEMASENEELHGRFMVLLLEQSQSPVVDVILDKYINFTPTTTHFSNTAGWAAVLVTARRGNVKAIKKMLLLAEKEHANIKFGTLFDDISSVHHEMCVQYLNKYLMSDYRVFPVRPGDPGVLLAGSAAHALGNMLVGFPECGRRYYLKADDLEPFRQWMSQQKHFKFK